MVNITAKSHTHRRATAQALVKVGSPATIQAVLERKVPKGDVLEVARTAGLFAAKRTADMIPDCHPLPVEYTSITYETDAQSIRILVEIQTIYKTGVEVEAMHAASVVALTIYDMLKPIDSEISIEQIRLVEKKGGKSDYTWRSAKGIRPAVIVCSDSIAAGKKDDAAGLAIAAKLKQLNLEVQEYTVVPDETEIIHTKVSSLHQQGFNLIILTGGTGLSPRDVTPEALEPLLEKRIPGIEEAIRAYGQQRTPYSMLSRSVAGLIGETLVLALPGSTRGAAESMDAIFPQILHLFRVMQGMRHD
jgi:molybdenum cofactor biosynthesis protein MoaC